jgi:hypothetical protein
MVRISGQETNHDVTNNWSASLSFSSIGTFYYYRSSQDKFYNYYSKGIREIVYPLGFNFGMIRNLNTRLSVSSGLNMKARMIDNLIHIIGEISPSYYEKSTDNRYILEIPLDFNYHILASPKLVDPYLKTGLRNSYFKRYYVGEYTIWGNDGTTRGEIDNHDSKFILFYEVGAGTYFNILKSISIMVESNLTYTISGFGYLELQGGLKYSFK